MTPVPFFDSSPEHLERMARLVPQLHADAPEGYAIVIRLHTEPAWTVELYGPLGAWCILSGPARPRR